MFSVLEHGYQTDLDVNLVAPDYPPVVPSETIPLDAASIENTFIGFCKTFKLTRSAKALNGGLFAAVETGCIKFAKI